MYVCVCVCVYPDKLEILTHPQSLGAVNGDKVTFALLMEHSEHLSYQWFKDGEPFNHQVMKSSSSIFTIDSFLPVEHKGKYECLVSRENEQNDGIVEFEKSKVVELKGKAIQILPKFTSL